MKRQNVLSKAVEKLTGLVDRLTDLVGSIQNRTISLSARLTRAEEVGTSLWEAVGDLRKNLGELRNTVQADIVLRKGLEGHLLDNENRTAENERGREYTQRAMSDLEKRTHEGFKKVQDDIERAWSLAESRNVVHRKAADDLTAALQRFNERLSKLEGPAVTQYDVTKNEIRMLAECLAAANDRLADLTKRHETLTESVAYLSDRIHNEKKEIRGVMPLFSSSTEEGMIKALPNILRMLSNPDFVKAVNEAGYKVDFTSVIALAQKLVDERSATQEDKKTPGGSTVWTSAGRELVVKTDQKQPGYHFDKSDPRVNPDPNVSAPQQETPPVKKPWGWFPGRKS